jgi:hypothetical protein
MGHPKEPTKIEEVLVGTIVVIAVGVAIDLTITLRGQVEIAPIVGLKVILLVTAIVLAMAIPLKPLGVQANPNQGAVTDYEFTLQPDNFCVK